MPVRHDYVCSCGHIEQDVTGDAPQCCGEEMQILWSAPPRPHIGIHPKDRAVVWYNPTTGRHATPGRNDAPMPDRYRQLGYERREFTTLRELDAFCATNRLVNQKGSYDGSGRSYDDEA